MLNMENMLKKMLRDVKFLLTNSYVQNEILLMTQQIQELC